MVARHAPHASSDRRTLLLVLFGSLTLFLLLTSLSASHHQHRSPTAHKLASYLPSAFSKQQHRPSQPPPPPASPFNHADSSLLLDNDPLAYRRHLEHLTSPPSFTHHAHSLGFDRIYVLSLPSRLDRRRDMSKLARALGVEIEFVDAADKNEPFLKWIAERVAESRDERRKVMARAQGVDPSSIGGLEIGSSWLTPFPSPASTSLFPPFPSSPLWPGARNWVEHLETLHSKHNGQHRYLVPSDSGLNVTELLWDPLERVKVRQVHEGVISTYWGQTRAIKRMLENGDETALILEDDVDVEWDVERLWAGIERRLPRTKEGERDWDVTFLGHCWGGEFQKPQYLHPLLHPSTGPMCLHGYALTSLGAQRLLSHLLSPWNAFSTAVDLLIPSLLHIQTAMRASPSQEVREYPPLLKSWSVVPPLVVQRKDGPSDLQKGSGSKWRGVLRDSTMERVRRDEGVWHEGWEEDPGRVGEDPATVLRCGPV
ncbi:hypothetical protein JCM8547_007701 [Rhodosporidiobolus lusitaniae]